MLEGEAAIADEVEQLRDGVGAILRIEEGVDQRCVVLQFGGDFGVAMDEVALRQGGENLSREGDAGFICFHVHAPQRILDHVDAGAARGGVDHADEDAIGREHIGEGAQAFAGVAHVVQHAGGDDEVEVAAELVGVAQVAAIEAEVGEAVAVLQEAFVGEAGFRQVDAGHLALAVGVGEHGGLHRAAAGDEDAELFAGAAFGPERSGIQGGIAHLDIAAIQHRLDVAERGRIRPRLVLSRDQARHVFHSCLIIRRRPWRN